MHRKKAILIVDDNETFRRHAAWFLERSGRFDLVGTAATAEDGVRQVEQLRPDVVLLDISLPDRNGLEVIEAMKAGGSGLRVIVLTSHNESEYKARAFKNGADGYVVKKDMARDLLRELS